MLPDGLTDLFAPQRKVYPKRPFSSVLFVGEVTIVVTAVPTCETSVLDPGCGLPPRHMTSLLSSHPHGSFDMASGSHRGHIGVTSGSRQPPSHHHVFINSL